MQSQNQVLSVIHHSRLTIPHSPFPIPPSPPAMTKPNIVLIVADDMGYGDFGVFNDGPARTPTLDHLVDESLCLTQHYSGSPVCSPARAALLTGLYPIRTGAITPQEVMGLDRIALREVMIADAFKQAGYATGLIGKWHNGALDVRFHQTNLAETEPMRTARMLNALETWFDEVESERRRFSINK